MKVCDICQSNEGVELDAGELFVNQGEKDRLRIGLDLCAACVRAAGVKGVAGLIERHIETHTTRRTPRPRKTTTPGPTGG